MSKGITLLEQIAKFNEDIRERRRKSTDPKTWKAFKTLFHRDHQYQRIVVPTAGKGGYTAAVKNIYSVPPTPPEEHHKAIDSINTIV